MPALWHDADNFVGRARQRPTAYALVALFMLLLANLFPFVDMQVSGLSSEIKLLEIPGCCLAKITPASAPSFTLRTAGARFCLVTILLLVNRIHMPRALKAFLARILFHLKTREWRRFSSPGAGELRQADGIR